MRNFWQKLQPPFTVLAPLDGATDAVFRQMIVKIGKPDVLFTEFTSCEGFMSSGREKTVQSLQYEPNEQPVVAQIWGIDQKHFYETAKYIKKMGFYGIDLNMGCPDRKVIKEGACSALMKNHTLASEIIAATKEGATGLPVSVKTRIGFEKEIIDEWVGFLLNQNLSALTIHLRTVAEMSKVPAHWEYMPSIISLRNKYAPQTLIIGNGDMVTLNEVQEKYRSYGCEGFMIGRGIFANPWLFDRKRSLPDITNDERFTTFLEHIRAFEKKWGDSKNFENLKKFCKAYINNFPQASVFREKIMETRSLEELKYTVTILKDQAMNS